MLISDDIFDDKVVLITGGTGSFGNQMIETTLSECNPKEIIVFSRDEKKQSDMRNNYKNSKIKYIIGDVRDSNSVNKVMKNVNIVFHAAALKQVPTCEFFPLEAVKTNVIGSNNVFDAAENAGVEKVVILSTDKAVYPINAMGMTKALMEKSMMAKARSNNSDTVYCGVRYGNVMYSRGSVLPLFLNQIQNKSELTITNPDMTRFLLPLPEAIKLVLYAIQYGKNGDMLVKKSPASTVGVLAEAMSQIFNHNKETKIIGIREGEKMHETLVTREELIKSENNEDFYRIKNLERIDYDKFFTLGKYDDIPEVGYTSDNTHRLTLEETKKLLLTVKEIKQKIGC